MGAHLVPSAARAERSRIPSARRVKPCGASPTTRWRSWRSRRWTAADGQPEGRYATWLPEGFPDYQVAYMDSEDWEVEVVFRGHERAGERSES